jgi:gamma-glutamyltranspeptidase / glutathione hydrolase
MSTTYKGVDVHVPGPSQLGGVELLEALNIVECAGAHVAKPSDESAESLYWLIQIARMPKLFTMMPAAHRDLIFGENSSDPGVRVSKEHAADLWRGIVASQEEGGPTLDDVLPRPGSDRGKHSDAVVAVDQFGNVAALTHTINCSLWGSTGLVVGGVSIPDAANFQQQRLLAAGPGGRIPNEMNPALVLRKGELVLASSCIGAGLHEVTLQALVRVLDQGLDPKQAVEAPTFLGFNWQGIAADRRALLQQVVPAWRFDDDLLKQVEAMGQRLFQVGRADLSTHNGMWIGILREEESGDYLGGVGPELNGRALAK